MHQTIFTLSSLCTYLGKLQSLLWLAKLFQLPNFPLICIVQKKIPDTVCDVLCINLFNLFTSILKSILESWWVTYHSNVKSAKALSTTAIHLPENQTETWTIILICPVAPSNIFCLFPPPAHPLLNSSTLCNFARQILESGNFHQFQGPCIQACM